MEVCKMEEKELIFRNGLVSDATQKVMPRDLNMKEKINMMLGN